MPRASAQHWHVQKQPWKDGGLDFIFLLNRQGTSGL